MKKIYFLALVLLFLSMSSCLKDSGNGCNQQLGNVLAPSTEVQSVQTYLTNNSITDAVQHSTGLFYKIITAGTGATPTQCNAVAVTYSGRLTNGNVFDQTTTPRVFDLAGLITGWRIGIPLIKAGGKIRLYIPPSLGYGSSATSSIPANSILIFDIELVNVG